MKESRSKERSGRIMYFPTRSASAFVLARTRLWTLKPVCRQETLLRSAQLPRQLTAVLADLERPADNDHILSVMPFELRLSPR